MKQVIHYRGDQNLDMHRDVISAGIIDYRR